MGLHGGIIPLKIADIEMFVGGDFILSVGGISYAEENAYFKDPELPRFKKERRQDHRADLKSGSGPDA